MPLEEIYIDKNGNKLIIHKIETTDGMICGPVILGGANNKTDYNVVMTEDELELLKELIFHEVGELTIKGIRGDNPYMVKLRALFTKLENMGRRNNENNRM